MSYNYEIPKSKKVTGQICHIGELTRTNQDLDSRVHKGFTIGKNPNQSRFRF